MAYKAVHLCFKDYDLLMNDQKFLQSFDLLRRNYSETGLREDGARRHRNALDQ